MKTVKLIVIALAASLAGCFTIHETPYAQVVMSNAPEDCKLKVALSGFEAFFTTYTPVRTYSTVWEYDPPHYHHGRYYYGGSHPSTYSSVTYIPQEASTGNAFMDRAIEILDDAGFPFVTADADCKIELTFSGPSESGGDMAKEFATVVFSIFTANYNVEAWGANLKIRDVKSGKVLFRHEYTERASAAVWGPIPIFSPAFADATDSSVLRSRALSSLTDRAMADATAFLAAFNMPQAQ